MADEKFTKLVHSTFTMYGLIIPRKLSGSLAKRLLTNYGESAEKELTKIVEQILLQNLSSPHVDLENIQLALKECHRPASTMQDTETVLNVIDVFTVPKVVYDLNKQKYTLQSTSLDLFSDAMKKSLVYKERLDLVWYRTQKHAVFAPSKFTNTEEKKEQLVPIEYLLSESKTSDICVMGILAQLEEGQWYLEDHSGSVKINLANTISFSKSYSVELDASLNPSSCYYSSLIVEGSIVLAKGQYLEGMMHIETMSFPPAELSSNSRVAFGDTNTFGGQHPTSLKLSEKLKAFEEAHANDIFFFSEFWVDHEKVLNKFEVLLSGFSDEPPTAIVLCGHFSSSPLNSSSTKKLREGFKKIAAIITRFPAIQESTTFVLVPGPYDPSAPKVLPRPPLSKYIVEDLIKVVPKVILATNPCRIQLCTKEIVVFRENILSKLCRNTLHYPNKTRDEDDDTRGEEVCNAFAKAIICQSHLAPLLYSTVPVYWKHDQALQLYPIPDLVVVADDFRPYKTSHFECKVMNPGPFMKSNFSFKSYLPNENEIEDCSVADDVV
ncbi:hypothetical protein QAD02_005366 [Eretmocerus hayati]|uniref:Uncharacterized protein n=1 Tax=Eretmocerus hayati TaxID=131215 RepID=A0ACC2NUY2_9HYME|nr:hypothetical protein QAD02_005366 [Eretmocerus hayati]